MEIQSLPHVIPLLKRLVSINKTSSDAMPQHAFLIHSFFFFLKKTTTKLHRLIIVREGKKHSMDADQIYKAFFFLAKLEKVILQQISMWRQTHQSQVRVT